MIQEGDGPGLVLLREDAQGASKVLVLVNLDCEAACRVVWPSGRAGDVQWFDLISGQAVMANILGESRQVELPPGGVMALTPEKAELVALDREAGRPRKIPARVLMQKRRALVLCVVTALRGYGDIGGPGC